ncbi:MAG: homocysteine S-methyltransferase family protein [Actinobacteria bacterium]|nr:homocysteine S-methyltransferase family protein [Actinomycetota bacterium]
MLEILDKKTLICDGAMGTSLQALGFKEPSDIFMLKNDAIEIVSNIHLQYLKAGSDIIQTNTFGSNILKLDQSGLSSEIENINLRALEAARKAVALFSSGADLQKKIYIAGDIGPSGELLQPYGDTDYSVMVASFSKQAEILLANDVDLILIETIMDLKEALAAIEAIRNIDSEIVIACSLTFMENGTTVMGNKAEAFGKIIIDAGCDIIGANCSVGSGSMVFITEKIRNANPDARLIIQPNAGLPKIIEGKTVFTETPEIMAENFKKILEFNLSIAGACCGSTPAHIRKISELVHGKKDS